MQQTRQVTRAVVVESPGGVEHLKLHDDVHIVPSFGHESLLIKVKATALNRADILQRQGKYPPPPGASEILGLEMAGEVESVGDKAAEAGWKVGDRVCALLGGGGYAAHCVIDHATAMRIPEGMSYEEAAAIPEAYLTAWQSLKWLANLGDGKTVLIHAAASGVGTAAIQIVKQFKDTKVLVTAGSEEKLEFCRKLGADFAFNRKDGPWADGVLRAVPGGVDIILDFVGASYWQQNLNALGTDGTMVILSLISGATVSEPTDLGLVLRKRLQIKGSTLRVRSLEYKVELTSEFAQFGMPLFAEGKLRSIVDKVFSWEQVGEAHTYMEQDKNIGKIVLTGM